MHWGAALSVWAQHSLTIPKNQPFWDWYKQSSPMARVQQFSLSGIYLKAQWMPLKALPHLSEVWGKPSATASQLMWSCWGSLVLGWFNSPPALLTPPAEHRNALWGRQCPPAQGSPAAEPGQQPSKDCKQTFVHCQVPQPEPHSQLREQSWGQTEESHSTLGAESCPAAPDIKALSWAESS